MNKQFPSRQLIVLFVVVVVIVLLGSVAWFLHLQSNAYEVNDSEPMVSQSVSDEQPKKPDRFDFVFNERFPDTIDLTNVSDQILIEQLREKIEAEIVAVEPTRAQLEKVFGVAETETALQVFVRVDYERDYADKDTITAFVFGLNELFNPNCRTEWQCASEYPITIQTACIGDLHEYDGLGYERVYSGNVADLIMVKAVLACDHEVLTVQLTNTETAEVYTQTITSVDYAPEGGDVAFLIDPSLTAGEVDFETDYNSDGYADLEMIYMSGSSFMWSHIFLFDPTAMRFIYSEALSGSNLEMTDKGILYRSYSDGYYTGYLDSTNIYYAFTEDTLLPRFGAACQTQDGALDTSEEKVAVLTINTFDETGEVDQVSEIIYENGDGCYDTELRWSVPEQLAETYFEIDTHYCSDEGMELQIEWLGSGSSTSPVFICEISADQLTDAERAQGRALVAEASSEAYVPPTDPVDTFIDFIYAHYIYLDENETVLAANYFVKSYMGANAATAHLTFETDAGIMVEEFSSCADLSWLEEMLTDEYLNNYRVVQSVSGCSAGTYEQGGVSRFGWNSGSASFEQIDFVPHVLD